MIVNNHYFIIFLLIINLTCQMLAYPRKLYGRKRRENLCPTEYESCWCEYTNPRFTNDQEMITNIEFYSPAIMINCNFHTDEPNKNKILNKPIDVIPKIININSIARQKHLSSITHLDLSRTDIFEFPTDAFQVCSRFYLKYFINQSI